VLWFSSVLLKVSKILVLDVNTVYLMIYIHYIQCVQEKWATYTFCTTSISSMLNKIIHAHTQMYLSYCRQISYDSIVPFNRCIVVTKLCHKCQLLTLWYLLIRHLTHHLRHVSTGHHCGSLCLWDRDCSQPRHLTSSIRSTGHQTARTSIQLTMQFGAFCKSKSPVAWSTA